MRLGAFFLPILLLIAMTPVPPLQADAPDWSAVDNKGCSYATGNHCQTGAIGPVTAGNLIVVGVSGFVDNKTSLTATMADTAGNVWTLDYSKNATYTPNTNFIMYVWIFSTHAASTVALDRFTGTTNHNIGGTSTIAVVALEVSGIVGGFTQAVNGKCTSSCGSTSIATSSMTFTNHDLIFSAVVCDCNTLGFTGGYIGNLPGVPNHVTGSQWPVSDGSVSSPTTFPWVASGLTFWLDVGVEYVANPPPTVIPCNWFQLQCWWYPLFFFSTYVCLIIPIAKAGEIDRRDFGWVFLSGFTLSSLIAVVMGMISIMVPMFLVGLGVLVALRS